MSPWYGFDFDGTLANYDHYRGATHTGEPVRVMVQVAQKLLEEGKDVRIFTARCYPIGTIHQDADPARLLEARKAVAAIEEWCALQFGRVLPVTCVKDYGMIVLYDDRAKQVIPNTGLLVEDQYLNLFLNAANAATKA